MLLHLMYGRGGGLGAGGGGLIVFEKNQHAKPFFWGGGEGLAGDGCDSGIFYL